MTSDLLNSVRLALMTYPQTVPAIKRIVGATMQQTVDALVHLRGNSEAICTEAEVDGKTMTVWMRRAGGVE